MTSILDRPVFHALTTKLAAFAVGGSLARRFATDIGPLAGAGDDTPESLAELAALVPADGFLLLLQADPIVLPPDLIAVGQDPGVQMVAERLSPPALKSREHIGRLTASDVPEMIALATLTKPGPFALRTHELGAFWGVKEGNRLVAMAGERLSHDGFTEVSGVCTHPDVRGRGLGRALSAVVATQILDRDEQPYLHAYASNTAAIELYESLGFRLRSAMHVARICRQKLNRG